MTRPRTTYPTDQDLRAIVSRLDALNTKLDDVLGILAAEPPRTSRAIDGHKRFYPGVGTITEAPRPDPGDAVPPPPDLRARIETERVNNRRNPASTSSASP